MENQNQIPSMIDFHEELRRKSYTSFGKLVLAEEKSNPIYTIGNANRFAATGDIITIPKDTPAPNNYEPVDVSKYKFTTGHKWKIGDSKRPPLNPVERYTHYNHVDKGENDVPKKWNTIKGGAIALEPRTKYDYKEKTPGPGRYEPHVNAVRPKSPAYYIAEKTKASSVKMQTGTGEGVGPGRYRVESAKYTSKHKLFPQYSIGKEKRKPLYNSNWTKNETYFMYSSCGNQVMSKKKTEPRGKVGKSTRDAEAKRGVFKSMMERPRTAIRIPMPKF